MKESLPSIPPDDDSEHELEGEFSAWSRFGIWLRSWKGIAAIALLMLVGAALWNGKSIYRSAKIWRASRLIARSEEAARARNFDEQFKLLREAFILAPSLPITLRAAAHYHESRGEIAALSFYESLFATTEATADDKLRAAKFGLKFGKINLARKLIDELRADEKLRSTPAFIALDAQLAASEEKSDQSIALARKAAANSAATGDEKLILAEMLARAPGSPDEREHMRVEAIEIFAELIHSADEIGAQAIANLVALAHEDGAPKWLANRDVAEWIEAAARHPTLQPRWSVAAWDLMLAARPNDADKTFDDFFQKWRESPLAQRLEAARWLNQHGKSAMSLKLSEPQRDVSSDWFLVYLDSLAANGNWDVVLDKLQNPTGAAAAMSRPLRAVFTMRARKELGQAFDEEEAWRDVQISLPGETISNQLFIAQYAEKIGELRQSASIFRRLLDETRPGATFKHELSREEKFACYSGVIRLTPETASAADLLPLFEGLSAEFPDMAEAANDAIYLRLLSGAMDQNSRDRSRELIAKNPAVLAYRSTAALCELRAGDAAAADTIYEGWQIDWNTAPERFKAVRVAILEAVGKSEDAKLLRESIDLKRLRPEEAKLIEVKR